MGILQDLGKAVGTTVGSVAGGAVGGWLGPIISIIDKIIPDPAAKAQAQLAVLQLQQAGELQAEANDLQVALSQNQVNLAEANSTSTFRAGWRPLAGWLGGFGLCYQYLVQPLLSWICLLSHVPTPPVLGDKTLDTLLFAMLGLGTHRTIEKLNGLA
jgi:hypothetical protein